MIRAIWLAAAVLAAAPCLAFETLGVLAVDDPPAGPDADLAELTHQLRAACRDRIGGVEDVPAMRARLLGQRSNATVTELDRAYGGALAVYQNGEFESAIRTLKAIVEDLESLPETGESYAQWIRAQLRLAHAALTISREKEAEEAMAAVARTDPTVQPEPDLYSSYYRRKFEQTKAKIRALPSRKLQVNAEGVEGTVFVNGRPMGSTPLTVRLPAGVYRIGGASGSLHVPSFRVDLQAEDRTVILDFALAEALRLPGGPGLALAAPRRAEAIIRAGAWLAADRIVAVSRATEGGAHFLLGSIYDVRNGALLREGSVRIIAGTVPSANLGALAAFLLTGQSSREVKDRTEAARAAPGSLPADARAASRSSSAAPAAAASPPSPKSAATGTGAAARGPSSPAKVAAASSSPAAQPTKQPADLSVASHELTPSLPAPLPALPESRSSSSSVRQTWIRPAAYGSAALVGVFTALAIYQGLSARQAAADAESMVGPDGALAPGSDAGRYRELRDEYRASARNAYLSGGAAVVFAVTAGVLGWKSRTPADDAAVAVRF